MSDDYKPEGAKVLTTLEWQRIKVHIPKGVGPVGEVAKAIDEVLANRMEAVESECGRQRARSVSQAWREGYRRGTLDATSDLEPADNPYEGDR